MKIKNCPFCGGEANYYMFNGTFGYTDNEHVIICKTCNLTMGDSSEISMFGGETEEFCKQASDRLIKRWNTRV